MLISERHLFIHDYVDLDTLLCLPFKNFVKPPFWIIGRRSTKVELGTEPPILSRNKLDHRSALEGENTGAIATYQYKNSFLGVVEQFRQRPHVIMAVDMPRTLNILD